MSGDRDDCGRAARLLELMDGAAEHEDDPTSVLPEGDAEWLAAHLDGCPACATSDERAMAPLFAALRAHDRADLPDELFFAARRREILSQVGGEPAAAARAGAKAGPAAPAPHRRAAARRT
ncbi:MAG: zf-HC2 domain-containing protein, partial [Thermodesulfobacteriota bacterium]